MFRAGNDELVPLDGHKDVAEAKFGEEHAHRGSLLDVAGFAVYFDLHRGGTYQGNAGGATRRLRGSRARLRMPSVRVLALETSTKVGSVALMDGEKLLGTKVGSVDARHGDTLVPMVQEILAGAGWRVEDLGLVAVGLGPGSFTGTRIAVACAKGLHLAAKVPLVGVSSFAAIARRALAAKAGPVGVVADAGRGAVFAALYADDGIRGETFEAAPDKALEELRAGGAAYFVGSALLRYETVFPRTLDAEYDQPRAEDIAGVAKDLGVENADAAATLEPLYVRGSDAKLPAEPLKVAKS